jgi:hypothetical protein
MGEAAAAVESRSVVQARQIVLRALAGLPVRVFLFGSRARGDAHPTSDIDIAVLPREPLPAGALAALRESLDEATIPQTVDLVDLSEVDTEFRERVLAEGVEWRA